ncbi:unnamed protein product [Victoria cruziana]
MVLCSGEVLVVNGTTLTGILVDHISEDGRPSYYSDMLLLSREYFSGERIGIH